MTMLIIKKMLKILKNLLETEGRTLQEIEDHFSGKGKLTNSMKRKEPVNDEPFPTKFDINHWDSNEKFEKILQQRKISQMAANGNGEVHRIDGAFMGVKRKTPTVNNNKPRVMVNDDDYDTPL